MLRILRHTNNLQAIALYHNYKSHRRIINTMEPAAEQCNDIGCCNDNACCICSSL